MAKIVFCTIALLLSKMLVFGAVQAETVEHPNVLLILTDDQGWGDLASHGNSKISTPTLDALANQSARLDRFYVSPVCAPTRAALLTGRYPERTGVAGVTGRREVMRAEETTLAEMFQAAGYATGCFGKWHNGAQMPLHPNGQGFDEFFGFCGGHFNLYDDALLERNGTPVQTKGYITDVLTDAAIEFVNVHRDHPFFCYVPLNAPHGPFQVRQELFDQYNDGTIDEKTAAVYAMVQNIDTNVSRLLKCLSDHSLNEETIVVFLTDNGPNGKRFNGGMRGAKGSVHEGGCRVPCFIRWPGKIKPQTIFQIAAHVDLLPTLAQWCDIPVTTEKPLDGRSLAKLIRDGSDAELDDRSILTYRPNQLQLQKFGKAAVRTNTHRLTIEKSKVSLFDMTNDPGQTTDVASSDPELTKQLRSQIEEYVQEITPSITAVRPVPIEPMRSVFVPAVDAKPEGGVGFADEISWAHSWIDRWSSPQDRIHWPIHVKEAGRYEIVIHYVCDSDSAAVVLTTGNQKVTTNLPRFAMKSVVRPDLDSKATPRRMLTFQQHSIGVVDLAAGSSTLTLHRNDQDGVMIELNGLTITRQPAE
ncbi:sulfatase-like hydrolase/transferase [Rhodopirellula europaea]|uniref:Arylsulfatase n=1 Tax=Rhodopirellula europaea 6C TaxID=1263867 RepID=M2AVS2_9BACT|nr:sulfatase-like hydrolase/transferase [Rhodopirellula europaea]EMB13628.1 arylsulfatase [Rhodopirellula europaea 6C]